ncbi:hypothetical protein [Azospirillum argentinense]|uniref:Uncharacterized protein n=1 Tax=Azospirillum argentinense TaxID=2970906 RepID=A0A5B0KNG4_9PROT|nr:hypothetical protein [Azospirillum argentinense]KAA1052948.1 hypothetical protein FH063_003355 [Azospirillum argentinense]
MASIKKGLLTASGEWAKHLRQRAKRHFWKGERQAARQLLDDKQSNQAQQPPRPKTPE